MIAEIKSVKHLNGMDPKELDNDKIILFVNGDDISIEMENTLSTLNLEYETYYSTMFEAVAYFNGSYYAPIDLSNLINELKV